METQQVNSFQVHPTGTTNKFQQISEIHNSTQTTNNTDSKNDTQKLKSYHKFFVKI